MTGETPGGPRRNPGENRKSRGWRADCSLGAAGRQRWSAGGAARASVGFVKMRIRRVSTWRGALRWVVKVPGGM